MLLAVVLVVGVLVVGLVAGTRGDDAPEASATPAAAADRDPAPEFTVPALEGGDDLTLAGFEGTPVVLNFWASWCPPCRAEMPALKAFADDNPDVEVVGLAVNDEPENSRSFADDLEITFPLGIDRDGSVSIDYGATGLPVTVFIDAQGNVAETWFGEITREDLDRLSRQVAAT